MPDINNYINEDAQKIDVDKYLSDTENVLEQKGVPDAKRFAYAIVVLQVNYEIYKRPWLNDLAVLLALKGYTNTINELQSYLI